MSLGTGYQDDDKRWTASKLRINADRRDVRIVGPCGLDRVLSSDEARKVALALREAADEADRPSYDPQSASTAKFQRA